MRLKTIMVIRINKKRSEGVGWRRSTEVKKEDREKKREREGKREREREGEGGREGGREEMKNMTGRRGQGCPSEGSRHAVHSGPTQSQRANGNRKRNDRTRERRERKQATGFSFHPRGGVVNLSSADGHEAAPESTTVLHLLSHSQYLPSPTLNSSSTSSPTLNSSSHPLLCSPLTRRPLG